MSPLSEDYSLLEAATSATPAEIKQAYLQLLQVWHPDRFQHSPHLRSRAEEKTKAIIAAFARIKDAPLLRTTPVTQPKAPPPTPPPPTEHPRPPSAPIQPTRARAVQRSLRPLEVLAFLPGPLLIILGLFGPKGAGAFVEGGLFWIGFSLLLFVMRAKSR